MSTSTKVYAEKWQRQGAVLPRRSPLAVDVRPYNFGRCALRAYGIAQELLQAASMGIGASE